MKKYALFKNHHNRYHIVKSTDLEQLSALARFLWDVGQSVTGAKIRSWLTRDKGCGGNISFCDREDNGSFSILAEIADPYPEINVSSEELMKILLQWDEVRKSAPPYIILTQEGTFFKLEGSDHVPEHLLDERVKDLIEGMDNDQYALKNNQDE